MEFSNYQRYLINSSFKDSVKEKPNTDIRLNWYEESGTSQSHLFEEFLWIDSAHIPETAPNIPAGEVYFYQPQNTTVILPILKRYEDVQLQRVEGTNASFKCDALKDSIESSFGTGYQVTITDVDGEEIPFGLNKWAVDTSLGVLSFLEGFPEGYHEPIYIDFYQYIGRKGTKGLVSTDGSSLLMEGYFPTQERSIVTKSYVDSNISDTNVIVNKLIPDTPATFEGQELSVLSEPHMKGSLVLSTDSPVDVVYSPILGHEHDTLEIDVPPFYKNPKGYVEVLVNNNRIYSKKCSDLVLGENNIFFVQDIFDPYKDNIVSDDFYESVKMKINLDVITNIYPYMPNSLYPIAEIKLRYYEDFSTYEYFSKELLVGFDDTSSVGFINKSDITDVVSNSFFISGVPALRKDDVLSFYGSYGTVKKFKKDVHGHLTIKDLFEKDIETLPNYAVFSPSVTLSENIVIPENTYLEKIDIHTELHNLEGINLEKDKEINIRVDAKSDESNRCTSPDNFNTYGDDWISNRYNNQSLLFVKELQMLGGKYQWPRGNYSSNGEGVGLSRITSGPNYDILNDINEERFVTLYFNTDYISGFYLEFEEPEGFVYGSQNKTIDSLSTFRCKVIDGHQETEWLNMNTPYDGVLNPADTESKGCLVINKSTNTRHYYTFGNSPVKGKLLINIGFGYNLDLKFKNIKIEGNP